MRAQTELPALGIALVLLTAVLVLGIGAADSALSTNERSALEQQSAVGLSEQLVADSAPVTARPNVLDADKFEELTATDLETRYGLDPNHDVRIELDGTVIVDAGDPTDGTTITRLVVVEERTANTLVPPFENNRTATIPQRSTDLILEIDPPAGTTIRAVRADDRTVLSNESGLHGTFDVTVSRFETQQLHFESVGPLTAGAVTITHDRIETRKATLGVTVDA